MTCPQLFSTTITQIANQKPSQVRLQSKADVTHDEGHCHVDEQHRIVLPVFLVVAFKQIAPREARSGCRKLCQINRGVAYLQVRLSSFGFLWIKKRKKLYYRSCFWGVNFHAFKHKNRFSVIFAPLDKMWTFKRPLFSESIRFYIAISKHNKRMSVILSITARSFPTRAHKHSNLTRKRKLGLYFISRSLNIDSLLSANNGSHGDEHANILYGLKLYSLRDHE